MPVCHKRGFAFIHIPKTGGSSISKMLDLEHKENFLQHDAQAFRFNGVDYAPQHLTPDLLRMVVPGFENLMTFCFTRHPYQKAVSEFFWLQPSFRNGKEEYGEDVFRDWIRDELSKKDCDHKIDQWCYAKDCDHVFKYSDFNNVVSILRGIGIEIGSELQHLLIPNHDTDAIVSVMSADICQMIEELYPDDFENLGYERHYTPEPIKELAMNNLHLSSDCKDFHVEGDNAYNRGDLDRAIMLWTRGAKLGSEQCQKNLEWVKH